MTESAPREYVLGTDEAELQRLGFQARLWSPQAISLWLRVPFSPGSTIIDAGCGPGFASRDLAQLLGSRGSVIAVDESESFIEHINSTPLAPGSAAIDARVADVQYLDLPPSSADGAYSRWVLCFVPDPDAVIAGVARALRPGAAFAVQDYSFYRGITWGPHSATLKPIIDAVSAAWHARGGDNTIGQRLPSLMEKHGLAVRDIRPLSRVARPSDALWQWPETFFSLHIPRLVSTGFLDQPTADAWFAEWKLLSNTPGAFFTTPPMIEVIGVKR